jgi:hypothetical protein
LVVRRRDHDGVNAIEGEQVPVGDKCLGFAAECFLHLGVHVLAGLLPRVGDGDDLEIGFLHVWQDALYKMRVAAAIADADLGDANAFVGPDGTFALGGAKRIFPGRSSGGGDPGRFQESATIKRRGFVFGGRCGVHD